MNVELVHTYCMYSYAYMKRPC